MDNIIEPSDSFDFSKISLEQPIGIQGGAYFTKITYFTKPLYIQTQKSLTRQGFVKSGKKYYCDLMFDNNSENLIQWFENLEETCKKLIYSKKQLWFQGELDQNDIDSAFNPLIRVYKSGKYYLLRTNIKLSKDDLPALKVYNENEIALGLSDVNSDTEIISILDIKGIKFTPRQFQIDIELKQVMVLVNEPIFDNYLIKTNKHNKLAPRDVQNENTIMNNTTPTQPQQQQTPIITTNENNHNNSSVPSNTLESLGGLESLEEETLDLETLKTLESSLGTTLENDNKTSMEDKHDKDSEPIKIEFQDLLEETDNNDLKIVNDTSFNLEISDDTITLKKPDHIFYNLYKEAKNKAKLAKKNAILAYLEAKNIRKTYMIDTTNDSDFDNEIDDTSESELECF